MFTMAYQIMCMVIKTLRGSTCGRLPTSQEVSTITLPHRYYSFSHRQFSL